MRILLALSILPAAFGQAPALFSFVPNTGQFPAAVRFVRYSSDNLFYLTRDSFVLQNGVRVQIAGIDPNAEPAGDSPDTTVYNFYQGNDPSRWMANTRLFQAVRIDNAYPGVRAVFTTAAPNSQPAPSLGEGKVVFTIAPSADPSPIRLRVLNTGAAPFQGPGGVTFAGGQIPGVFTVSVRATETAGDAPSPVTSRLKIESADTLSIELPDRNPSFETDVEIAFPDYDISPAPSAAGIVISTLENPTDFGQDGAAPNHCVNLCRDALVARFDSQGNCLWVTVFGGTGDDTASFATAAGDGVSVSGTTSSSDLPVTPMAPYSRLSSPQDLYLASFDEASGQLRNATYAGLQGAGTVTQQVVDAGGDTVIGASYSLTRGYILRWRPSENRFVYSLALDAPVRGLAMDPSSSLYFAEVESSAAGETIVAGAVDAGGKTIGSTARVGLPSGTVAGPIPLQPAGGGELWAAYLVAPAGSSVPPAVWVARVSTAAGQPLANAQVAVQGIVSDIAMTPSGSLKLLVQGAAATESTTPDAPLAAACPGSGYFIVLAPSLQLAYGTYVSSPAFDFAAQNESNGMPPPSLSCFANAAGRVPGTVAAPGELITLTGGGFGQADALRTAPGPDGLYPRTAAGFRVTISGVDAPILAVARGLITVQVPFEVADGSQPGQSLPIVLLENGAQLGSITMSVASSALSLFTTSDRANPPTLPALAALNEDGSVNSVDNPAATGSAVTLFGSGLGVLSPPLPTGGLNPGSLSTRSVQYQACVGCSEILFLGSAPGLSTGVVQIRVRLPGVATGIGAQAVGIGLVASDTLPGLSAYSPTGVVFVK